MHTFILFKNQFYNQWVSCWGLEHVQGARFGADPTDRLLSGVLIFLQNIIDIVASALIKLEGKQVYYQLSHTHTHAVNKWKRSSHILVQLFKKQKTF